MPINLKETKLRPLPLRVTPLQRVKLVQLRAKDSLSLQEHIRRAIDMYLEAQDRKAKREASTPSEIIHGAGPIEQAYQAPTRDIPLPAAVTARPKIPERRQRNVSYGLR